MRDPISPPRELPKATRSQVRRRRLHRGARSFQRDVCSDGNPVHYVVLFALTVASLELDQVQGAVRALMKQLRDTQPGLRYFWWAEFQARGAVHFHGMLVNPRFEFERDARTWFGAHWPHAEIQPWAKRKSGWWFEHQSADYVMKDTNKGARKGYQQNYEAMPAYWKTFASHRLAFTVEEHQEHEDRAYAIVRPETGNMAVYAVDRHCAAWDGCHVRKNVRRRLQRKTRRWLRARARAPAH